MTDKRLTAVVVSTEQQLIINSVKLNKPESIWQLIPEKEATCNPATLMQSVFMFQLSTKHMAVFIFTFKLMLKHT